MLLQLALLLPLALQGHAGSDASLQPPPSLAPGALGAAASEDAPLPGACGVSLLQLAAGSRLPRLAERAAVGGQDAGRPAPPVGCRQAPSEEDFERPIHEVLAQHPGVDGHCYFAPLADYVAACAEAGQRQDYGVIPPRESYGPTMDRGAPEFEVRYDGGAFASRNTVAPYDDLYCHANRWFLGQGLPAGQMSNYTAWSSLAAAECQKLEGLFSESDMTMGEDIEHDLADIERLSQAIAGNGTPPTTRDMQRHAAVKCALGNLGCDMALCVTNGCVLEEGGRTVIGRGLDCAGVQ